MVYVVCVLSALIASSVALQISTIRPYFGNEGFWSVNSTHLGTEVTHTFTSGFLRTDTYLREYEIWIRAQILPIGVCFREGERGGSAEIVRVVMDSKNLVRVTNIYSACDCTGTSRAMFMHLPVVESYDLYTSKVSHEPNFEAAAKTIPPSTDGTMITSYYSSDGCVGEPAQYDLFATDMCHAYQHPTEGRGIFFQCDMKAGEITLLLYGQNPDACAPSDEFDDIDTLGAMRTIEQPFQCTREKMNDNQQEVFPLYQTVRCMPGMPNPHVNSSRSKDMDVGCIDDERDPEFDLFHGENV